MINLLPPEMKDSYKYARFNVSLRAWVFRCLAALIGLGLLATYGLVTLHRSTVSLNQQISTSQHQLQQDNYSSVQAQVQDISNNFKLAVKVLSQEVLFSSLLKQIATLIPTNANLTGLQISQISGAIDITANATDYNTATQVQINLSDTSNKIFSKADIVSITCSTDSTNMQYPCTVVIKALFAPNNPFLFINSQGGEAK
jgi:hypothetical protein